MKYWNELDESIFFCKLFSHPIEIGRISLFSLQIENDQPSLGLGFDIPEFPDNLPEKWQNKGFNTCRLGLTCSNISDLKITNIPTKEIFSATIERSYTAQPSLYSGNLSPQLHATTNNPAPNTKHSGE
ncbi:Imm50 family immunity protein [Pseudomonas sp. Bout1]|uniref:Imm50 family immunity protein n=1 Tax=Pseudomonas sp. Bout1 TaxID=3048600 RepID=UPI002AB53210|nr:Imm50 family immunity protein [Pseudomonas sp. Bout1]MDY7532830.1 Imm50 family immunity protein [Pseudomonas sp. Bout1]